jgi:hypothetical protein
MNCKELIELYHKVGGIMRVDYRDNSIKVKNTNLHCQFNEKEYYDIEYLTVTFDYSPFKTRRIIDENVCHSCMVEKNRHLQTNECGFVIRFLTK